MHKSTRPATSTAWDTLSHNTMGAECQPGAVLGTAQTGYRPDGHGIAPSVEMDIALGNLEAALAQIAPAVDRAVLLLDGKLQGQVCKPILAETLERKALAFAHLASRLWPAPYSTAVMCGEN